MGTLRNGDEAFLQNAILPQLYARVGKWFVGLLVAGVVGMGGSAVVLTWKLAEANVLLQETVTLAKATSLQLHSVEASRFRPKDALPIKESIGENRGRILAMEKNYSTLMRTVVGIETMLKMQLKAQ